MSAVSVPEVSRLESLSSGRNDGRFFLRTGTQVRGNHGRTSGPCARRREISERRECCYAWISREILEHHQPIIWKRSQRNANAYYPGAIDRSHAGCCRARTSGEPTAHRLVQPFWTSFADRGGDIEVVAQHAVSVWHAHVGVACGLATHRARLGVVA